jgi:hypothetical protein
MNKAKLQKILRLIKNQLLKLKSSQKYWITEEDSRYTKLLNQYSKQLSKLWKKTRNSYASKVKTKASELDLNPDPEDYEDPQYNSSQYIDQALAILAEAFGAAVIIGFEEIQSRDITVSIPANPHTFFNEAQEIKNYSHAALSYEQLQFDDIFNEYNKLSNGKKLINDWFDTNEFRLTDLMLGGILWYGIQYGFVQAAIEAQEVDYYWITEADNRVCDDCIKIEDGNPYTKQNPLPTLPGGGKTLCGSRCRCVIDIK